MRGVCQWFDKKHGFIKPDGGGADVFVHQTDLRSGTEVTKGDHVEFGTADYKGREKAVDVIKVGPAAVIAPARHLSAAEAPAAETAPKGPSLAELAGRAARNARSPRSRSRSRRRSRRRSPSRSGSRSRSRGRRRRDRAPTTARRHRGVYHHARGHEIRRYGFITPDHLGPTVFMHLDDVQEGHIVRDGDSVEYCLVPCLRRGKERAVYVVKLTSWVPDGTVAARTNEMLAGDHSIKAQFDDGTLTVRTLRAAVAKSLGVEEAAVKKVVKETLMAALEAARARSPPPPPSEVSDDSGAAAPALVIDVGSPRRERKRDR